MNEQNGEICLPENNQIYRKIPFETKNTLSYFVDLNNVVSFVRVQYENNEILEETNLNKSVSTGAVCSFYVDLLKKKLKRSL